MPILLNLNIDNGSEIKHDSDLSRWKYFVFWILDLFQNGNGLFSIPDFDWYIYTWFVFKATLEKVPTCEIIAYYNYQ